MTKIINDKWIANEPPSNYRPRNTVLPNAIKDLYLPQFIQYYRNYNDTGNITLDPYETITYKGTGEIFKQVGFFNLDYANSIEGRHKQGTIPEYQQFYQGKITQTGIDIATLEQQFVDEERLRYGDNQPIPINATMTDQAGNQSIAVQARLRVDGGYDIQWQAGYWEYTPGEKEWSSNLDGGLASINGVIQQISSKEDREKQADMMERVIREQRDRYWDSLSFGEKLLNGINLMGKFTQDYLLPAVSVLSSGTLGTLASIASSITDEVVGSDCRDFNECTDQLVQKIREQYLYPPTIGDYVAQRYLSDDNWATLLEANPKAHQLIRDNVKYGSNAQKEVLEGQGGYNSISKAFRRQLKQIGMTPFEYLKTARERAKEAGYDQRALEFSDDDEHKLMIWDDEGKSRHFGRVGYNDFIIWSFLEKKGEVKPGFARTKQNVFQKSHSKIRGDWKSDPYSANNLALRINW
jgi:hypothetical protein